MCVCVREGVVSRGRKRERRSKTETEKGMGREKLLREEGY